MITTKGRYALRIMLDLAECEPGRFIALKDIADRQELSKKYLEIIARDLVKGKLIEGSSGKNGGYRLNRTPEEYPIGEILEKMEGTLAPVACLAEDAEECTRKSYCKTLPLWTEYYKLERDFFYGKTLADLLV